MKYLIVLLSLCFYFEHSLYAQGHGGRGGHHPGPGPGPGGHHNKPHDYEDGEYDEDDDFDGPIIFKAPFIVSSVDNDKETYNDRNKKVYSNKKAFEKRLKLKIKEYVENETDEEEIYRNIKHFIKNYGRYQMFLAIKKQMNTHSQFERSLWHLEQLHEENKNIFDKVNKKLERRKKDLIEFHDRYIEKTLPNLLKKTSSNKHRHILEEMKKTLIDGIKKQQLPTVDTSQNTAPSDYDKAKDFKQLISKEIAQLDGKTSEQKLRSMAAKGLINKPESSEQNLRELSKEIRQLKDDDYSFFEIKEYLKQMGFDETLIEKVKRFSRKNR